MGLFRFRLIELDLGLGFCGFSLRVLRFGLKSNWVFKVVGFSVGFRLRVQEGYWAYSLVRLGLG